MKREHLALLFFGAALVALCALCFVGMARWRVHRATHDPDQLLWLRREFKLSAAELERVRALHAGYRPRCEALCVRIAQKKAEALAELAGATHVTPMALARLREAAELHAECQAQMLAHFYEVSRAMSPEQGRRYFEEMKHFVLTGPGAAGHDAMQESLPMNSHGIR